MKLKVVLPLLSVILVLGFVFIGLQTGFITIPAKLLKSDGEDMTYPDGSQSQATVDYTGYEHKLFGQYFIRSSDRAFSQDICMAKNTDGSVWDYVTRSGYYVRYCFDPAGYIMYYRMTEYNPNYEETVLYERYVFRHPAVPITSETAAIYDCAAGKEITFDTVNEMLDYCDKQGIKPGQWYWSHSYYSRPETVAVTDGSWTICTTPWEYSVVKRDGRDMFMGAIDEYAETDGKLIFHLTVGENDHEGGLVNGLISYSRDEPAGRSFKGLFKGYRGFLYMFADVWYDKYIAVDTNSGDFTEYAGKKELLRSLGGTSPEFVKLSAE